MRLGKPSDRGRSAAALALLMAGCGSGPRPSMDGPVDARVVDAFPYVDAFTCDNTRPPSECPAGYSCCTDSLEGGVYQCLGALAGADCIESPAGQTPTACNFNTGEGCPSSQPLCCAHRTGPRYCSDHPLYGWNCFQPALADAQPPDAPPVDGP